MAGMRLPFLETARELLVFLRVAPSQIVPNTWRYLFASFISWKNMLRTRMSIEQFFNIYRLSLGKYGLVETQVRQDPVFIHLDGGKYSNKGF